MSALGPIALLACHPIQERHDPFPDEDYTDSVEITVTVGGERVASEQLPNPPDGVVELLPEDGASCGHAYRWDLQSNTAEVWVSAPTPPEQADEFPFGSNKLFFWTKRDEALQETALSGGTARFDAWTPELRSLTLTGAERCVSIRGEEPTCAPAPPVTVAIQALDDDPELPGQTCYLSTMPVPDWPEPGPGPCAYAETRCP